MEHATTNLRGEVCGEGAVVAEMSLASTAVVPQVHATKRIPISLILAIMCEAEVPGLGNHIFFFFFFFFLSSIPFTRAGGSIYTTHHMQRQGRWDCRGLVVLRTAVVGAGLHIVCSPSVISTVIESQIESVASAGSRLMSTNCP